MAIVFGTQKPQRQIEMRQWRDEPGGTTTYEVSFVQWVNSTGKSSWDELRSEMFPNLSAAQAAVNDWFLGTQ